jgi:hypothetical protein
MKFFVTNDLKKEHPLKIMITAFITLIALFIISDVLVKGSMFGSDTQTVYLTLVGDEANFTEPYTFGTLLEMIHTDLFFFTLLFLVLAALCFRVSKESLISKVMMLSLLVLLIISTITPFIALNGSQLATSWWFYSFLFSHILACVVVLHIVWILWFKK